MSQPERSKVSDGECSEENNRLFSLSINYKLISSQLYREVKSLLVTME